MGEGPDGFRGAGPQNPDPDNPKPGTASRIGPQNPGLGGLQQGEVKGTGAHWPVRQGLRTLPSGQGVVIPEGP